LIEKMGEILGKACSGKELSGLVVLEFLLELDWLAQKKARVLGAGWPGDS